MSYSYGAPPSVSSGALRSLTADFPEEGQTTVAGAYAAETTAPTYSTGFIRSSQLQFSAGGQRALTGDEFFLAPPEETDLRNLQHSSNLLSENGHRGWGETEGGGSLSGFVHPNNSANGVLDLYGKEVLAPGISGFAQRDHSSTGLSSDHNTTFDPLANPGHSMVGNKFRDQYKKLNQIN